MGGLDWGMNEASHWQHLLEAFSTKILKDSTKLEMGLVTPMQSKSSPAFNMGCLLLLPCKGSWVESRPPLGLRHYIVLDCLPRKTTESSSSRLPETLPSFSCTKK